jgi:hypothetical protein
MNNGEISYGVREAEEIGMAKSVSARMFKVLVERGFLVVTRDSAFRIKCRDARLWRLTAERCGEERATKDFMRWSAKGGNGAGKIKQQSHQRDTQSLHRDSDGQRKKITCFSPSSGTVEPNFDSPTVPPAGHF